MVDTLAPTECVKCTRHFVGTLVFTKTQFLKTMLTNLRVDVQDHQNRTFFCKEKHVEGPN